MSKTSFLRNRFNETLPTTSNLLDDHNDTKSKYHRPMPYVHFLALLGLILIVFALVIIIEKQLPVGLRIEDESSYPETFIAERAYNIVKNLTALGPRTAGSYENEVLAVNFLRTEIDTIIKEAKSHHSIEVDMQKASGAFNLKFLDGMTNVYRDVQNVVVKMGSGADTGNSLLINCHFDSVVDSPGASDDGASCAVMLEILRVLSKSNTILRHNIIFLFNGGEENFLPGSHGFITQHKWAKEVRAFINLEACGAGGREVLFQAGPNHPWMLETYSREVPYPCASSLAQEIFQSGVVPGDTDYRIFRDFGNLSGLDFAWSTNGYVYHTKFDSIEQIPIGSLQRTGDNILALARGMALGPHLSDVQKYRAGNLVFFDFLGAFVIRWPMLMSDIINISTVIFSFYSIWANVKKATYIDDIKKRQYMKKLLSCIFAVIISSIFSVLSSVLIAALLTCLGRTMSWYARPLWVFFLYIIPTLIVSMATILLHAKVYNKDLNSAPWAKFQLYYDAGQTLWTLGLILGIIVRVRSSFVALLWTLFAAIGNILKSKFYGRWRDSKWLLLHIAVMGLPFVQCFYLLIGALYLFIPIMGRAGSSSYAEFLIAVLVSCTFISLFIFVVPLVILIRGVERIFSLLTGLFWISLALLILTPLGFPYSGEAGYLAPQRFMIPHTRRNFRDVSGNIQNHSSGFWIADMDINSPHSVDRHVPQMVNARSISRSAGDCGKYLYCGLPYLVPVLTMISKTHWLPGPEPVILTPITMEVMRREKIPSGERLTLKVEGPSHIGVIVSPVLGVHLTGWSLKTEKPLVGPKWNNRETYFIYYAYGLQPVPLIFSMDFKIPSSNKGPIMDLAITSHYLFGPGKTSETLENLISQFPQWASVTHWTASYDSWIL